MTSSNSLVGLAVRYWLDFYRFGLVAFVSVLGIAIPAGLTVFYGFRAGFGFFLLAVLSWGVHLAAKYTREVRRGSVDISQKSGSTVENNLTVLGVVVSYFTFVLLGTSIVTHQLAVATSSSLIAIIFALYYPVLDFEIVCRYKKSLGSLPILLLFRGFDKLGVVEDISPDETITAFVQNPPKLITENRPRSPF